MLKKSLTKYAASLNVGKVPPHERYLWGCKMKNRDLFMLIFSFFDFHPCDMGDMLTMVKRFGAEGFFENYMKNNEKFKDNNIRLKHCLANKLHTIQFDWIPS